MPALAATIQTDLFVYQNGDTVTVTGNGFGVTETVDLVTTDPNATVIDQGKATTDASGNFTYPFTLNATVGGIYTVNAAGETSGLTASTQFDPDQTTLTLSFTSPDTYGIGVAMSGVLTDTKGGGSTPVSGRPITLDSYSNSSCSQGMHLATLGTSTTNTSGVYTLTAFPEAGSQFVEASFVGDSTYSRSSSSCMPLTISTGSTTTLASPSVNSILSGGQTLVSWAVSSNQGVTNRMATGTGTLVKDSGGTLTCSPASVAVTASQTTGTGFTFTANSSQKFTCSATALGTYSYHVHFADSASPIDGNYSNSDSAVMTLNVVSATTLTVQSESGTYGGTLTTLQATLSSSGSVNNKTISFTLNGHVVGSATTNSSGIAALSNVSLAGINAGTYSTGVGASFAGDSLLAAASATASLEVNAKAATVTADPKSKTYGDADPGFTYTTTGLVGTDTLTGVTCGVSVAHSDAGSYAIKCSGNTNANYSVSYADGALTVSAKAATVTADSKAKTYGDVDPGFTYTTTGLVGTDTLTGVTCGVSVAHSDAGSYAIKCSGNTNANYSVSYADGALTVSAKAATVTADSKAKTYGDVDPGFTYTTTGLVGTDTLTGVTCGVSVAHSDAGSYAIKCSGNTNANYSVSYVDGALTVSAKAATVTADSKAKTYGDVDPGFTYTTTGLVGTDTLTGVTCGVSVAHSDAGSYAIKCSGNTNANYSVSYADGALTVSAKAATVTADSKAKTYGDVDPGFTYTTTGLVGTDTLTGVTCGVSVAHSDAGSYAIKCSGNTNANYSVSYADGALTVSAKAATVTADSKAKTYGDVDPGFTYTTTGLVGTDTLTGVTCGVSVAHSDAGSYAIKCSGNTNANYSVSYADGALTVSAKAATVTADSKAKTYGDVDPGFTYTTTGLVGTDTLTGVTCGVSVAHSDAGSYTIKCSGNTNANYSVSYVDGILAVNKATLTVTADDKTREYGDANPAFTASYSGFKNGETLATSGVTGSPSLSTTADVSSTVSGSPYTIAAALGTLVATNYEFAFVGGTLTVTKATLTVTANDTSREYGDTNLAFTATITGFKNGETLATSGVTGSPALTTTADASSQVGSYPIMAVQGSLNAGNYQFTLMSGTLTVTKATLTVRADDKTRLYGADNPPFTATFSGFKNGESLATSGVSGSPTCDSTATALSQVVGSPYPITCVVGSLSSHNYLFSFVDGHLYVNPAPLTITANDQTKAYGAAVPALTVSYSGFVNGEDSSAVTTEPTVSTTATATSHVAGSPYLITASGAVDTNYDIHYINGALEVIPVGLTITADNKSMTYGGTQPTLTATYTGLVNGDMPATFGTDQNTPPKLLTVPADSHVGMYEIGVSGAVDADYSITYVSGTLTINPAPLTITADSKTKAYGDGLPGLTASYNGLVNGDMAAALNPGPTLTTTATAASHVGTYTISASGANDHDYVISYVAGTLTVTPVALTITADDKSMTYGGTLPMLTVTYTGLVNGDMPATFGTAPNVAPTLSTVPATSHAGSYDITASGASDPDYTITLVKGTLTINPAPLTITADSKTKAYGDGLPGLTASYNGLVNGDMAAALNPGPTLTTTATAASHVGTYTISASGANDHDYVISYVAGTLTVTPVALTITADDKSMTYGGTLPVLTVTYTGLVNGDMPATFGTAPNVAPTLSTVPATSHAGSYDITASGASDPDYTITLLKGTLTINPAPLTITADNKSMTYGGTLPVLTVTYTGLVNGDIPATFGLAPNVAPVLSAVAATSHAGSYDITASGASDPDYTITLLKGTLTINPAPLTITANNKSMTYGGTLPVLTVTYTGLVNGDMTATFGTAPNVAPTLSTVPATSHAGSYDITASGASDPDYTITLLKGTLTINPAPLTITANNKSMTYGGTLPVLTVTYTGLVNGDMTATFGTAPNVAPTLSTVPATSHAGSYDITASGASDPDYTITLLKGTLTINPASLTIAADNKTKAYGAALPTLTASYGGFVNGDTAVSLTKPPMLSTTATAASHIAGNPYAITALGAVDSDYTISYAAGTLTVTAVGLTITADNKSKVYGAALPVLTASFSAFVNGDTPASLTTSPTLSTTATPSSLVGTYSITTSGAVDSDYTIAYVAATLTVTPAPLSVTADSKLMVLNAPVPTLTGTLVGVTNSDTITASYSTTADGHTVGNFAIVPSLNDPGRKLSNYTVTINSATLQVLYVSSGTCDGDAGHVILQPINSDGTSVFKQGSTVPAKIRVCDANGNSIGTAGVVQSFVLYAIGKGTDGGINETVVSTTPDTAFRWDSTNQQWIFNISTKNLSANQTYTYLIVLNDGSKIWFTFGLR